MPTHKKLYRFIKIIAEMKKNNYPNATSFMKMLHQLELEENVDILCVPRTLKRDIEELKTKYKAPIEFCRQNNGYYLTDPNWTIQGLLVESNLLDVTMLSHALTTSILPNPYKKQVTESLDMALVTSPTTTKFFNRTTLETLINASELKTQINPDIYESIIDAWCLHQTIDITYSKPNSPDIHKTMEPHIIAFYHGNWYVKGYEYNTKNVKSYAIHRIKEVKVGRHVFTTDKKLIEETRRNGLFEYPKISGIRLKCDSSIAFYLREHQPKKNFKIEPQEDGSLIITLTPAVEHEVIRWVLGEAGRIEVLYPPELRQKIAEAGKKIVEKNS